MVHENSTLSYQEHKDTGKAEAWRKKVFDVFQNNPDKLITDRCVVEILSAHDVNLVRPEITRLIQDGILKEVGKTKCVVTGKTVRMCSCTGEAYYSRGNKKPLF
jgi:hypothetical protein